MGGLRAHARARHAERRGLHGRAGSSRPRRATPGGDVTEPPPTTPAADPLRQPEHADPRSRRRTSRRAAPSDEATEPDSAPVRFVLRPLATDPADRPRRRARCTCSCSRPACCRGAARGAGAPSRPPPQIELAWTESVEEAAIVGFQRAAERHLRRARPPAVGQCRPDGRGRRVQRWPAGSRRRSTRPRAPTPTTPPTAWEAADAIGAAARARTTREQRVRRWLDPRTLVQDWRRSHTARQRRITMTARGDLEAGAGAGGERRPGLSPVRRRPTRRRRCGSARASGPAPRRWRRGSRWP